MRRLLLFLLCNLLAAAQAPRTTAALLPSPTPAADIRLLQELLAVGPQPQLIHPGDVLEVAVFGVKEFDFREPVSNNGELPLPLIGLVQVAGATPHGAAAMIENTLAARGMISHAHVDVSFVAQPSAVVTIAGEVRKPGTYSSLANLTLTDYLTMAEGLKDTASSTLTLIRPGSAQPIAIPFSPGREQSAYGRIRLLTGDQIICNKVGVFYIVGAVKLQGAQPLKGSSPTTVLQAIALAGGIGYEADLSGSEVVRSTPEGQVVLPLNLRKLTSAAQSAFVLQPDDILFIPTSRMKAAIKGGGTAIVIALATSLAYVH